jgi:hypothetical protein
MLVVTALLVLGASLGIGRAPAPPVGEDDSEAWAAFDQSEGDASVGAQAGVQPVAGGPEGSGTADNPRPTAGGGEGGESRCTWTPVGPIAEVQAAQAAINAQQAPSVSDPNYVEDVIGNNTVTSSWYRVTGTTAEVKGFLRCEGQNIQVSWRPLVADGSGNLVVQVSAQDLLPGARDRVVRRLPTPVPRIMPADEDANGFTYVQNRTFFWVEQRPGLWEPVSATASAGGISVTVQATPVRLVVDPGDGSEKVVCEGAPPPVTKATYHPDIEGCSFIYRHSSATAPNGETFPVVASIVWHATWTASTGEGGDLGYLSTTSDVRDLAVAEVQALIVATEP